MVEIVIGVLVIVLIIILSSFLIANYNILVKLRNRVKDQWAQVDVVLKKRADLIPNLVETVQGYAKHENDTLEAVIQARNKFVDATNKTDEMKADASIVNTLGKLMAVSENYPELKANINFLDLQKNLKELEDKIQYARQFYNDTVLKYKDSIEMFPSNLVAKLFGFKQEEFFEVDEEDREAPEVNF